MNNKEINMTGENKIIKELVDNKLKEIWERYNQFYEDILYWFLINEKEMSITDFLIGRR